MHVLLVTHDSFGAHDTGRWHPERPARVTAAVRGVEDAPGELTRLDAPLVDLELLEQVHRAEYIEAIERFCAAGGGALDPDTHAVPASWEAALRSAGAGPAAIDQLQAGAVDTAFLAVRPPGHHALVDRAMGFCLFNNVAIAARVLLDAGQKVAILDWDVHHGNGTDAMFVSEPDVLYVSFHQYPFYPGTGWLDSMGTGRTGGTTINIPLPAGTSGDVYRAGMEQLVVPILRQYAPDWILVSAGYDAHADDPLAELRLLPSDYASMAADVHRLAGPSRVLYFLEGGYDLDAIRRSVAATLTGAAGGVVADESLRFSSPDAAYQALDDVLDIARSNWNV